MSSAAIPISAPHHFQTVARQGIEPCLTVSKTVVRIHHTRKPSQFSVHARNRTRSSTFAGSRALHYTSQTFFKQWCRRDSNPQSLVPKTSRSAVGVPHHLIQATHTGFEPVISAVTGRRPLQAGPMGRNIKDAIEIRTQPNMFCRHVPRHTD